MKVQGFVLNLPGCPDPVAQSVVGPGQWGTVEPRAESFPRSRRPFPSLAIRGERSALLHPSRSPLPPASAPSVECGWVAGSVPLPFAMWSRVWEGRCASSGCGWRMDCWGPGGAGGWSQEEPRHPVGGRLDSGDGVELAGAILRASGAGSEGAATGLAAGFGGESAQEELGAVGLPLAADGLSPLPGGRRGAGTGCGADGHL